MCTYINTRHLFRAIPQKPLPPLKEGAFNKRVSELTQKFGRYLKVRKERGTIALIIFPPGREIYEIWERSK